MVDLVNLILELVFTGLCTAVFLVVAVRLHWFPVLLVEAITQEEYEARNPEGEGDE